MKTALRGRVLLAEDTLDTQRLLALHLRIAGLEVTAVENGLLACEAALESERSDSPFDVVLCDMQMPVMDGYTAVAKLRAEGYSRPIIALTAHAMESDRQACLDAGCDDFHTKPIDKQQLLALLGRYVSEPSTGATA